MFFGRSAAGVQITMDERGIDCLTPEALLTVFSFFNALELTRCCAVSRQWLDLANSNSLWKQLCESLWQDKVYVPKEYKKKAEEMGLAQSAYKESLEDAKRGYITAEELCSFTWRFRYKKMAGENWLANDPWWNSKPAAESRFFLDGTMERKSNQSDQSDQFYWKFAAESCGKKGPKGSFIRLNRFPTYHVSRYKNWGFLLQSCWGFFASFYLPPKGVDPSLEDSSLEVSAEQVVEAFAYNGIGNEFPFVYDGGYNGDSNGTVFNNLQFLFQLLQAGGNSYSDDGDGSADVDIENNNSDYNSDRTKDG